MAVDEMTIDEMSVYPEWIFVFGTANNKRTYYSSTHPPSQQRPRGLIAHSLLYFKDKVYGSTYPPISRSKHCFGSILYYTSMYVLQITRVSKAKLELAILNPRSL